MRRTTTGADLRDEIRTGVILAGGLGPTVEKEGLTALGRNPLCDLERLGGNIKPRHLLATNCEPQIKRPGARVEIENAAPVKARSGVGRDRAQVQMLDRR